jgi:hypothetical protein
MAQAAMTTRRAVAGETGVVVSVGWVVWVVVSMSRPSRGSDPRVVVPGDGPGGLPDDAGVVLREDDRLRSSGVPSRA